MLIVGSPMGLWSGVTLKFYSNLGDWRICKNFDEECSSSEQNLRPNFTLLWWPWIDYRGFCISTSSHAFKNVCSIAGISSVRDCMADGRTFVIIFLRWMFNLMYWNQMKTYTTRFLWIIWWTMNPFVVISNVPMRRNWTLSACYRINMWLF